MSKIANYWKEEDKDIDIANDVQRLKLESQNVILELRVKLSDIQKEYENYLRSSQGDKGAFKTALSYQTDISDAELAITTAEDFAKELLED